MRKIELIHYNDGKKETRMDNVVNEHELVLFVDHNKSYKFQTYPQNSRELIIGFLFSQRFILSMKDLKSYTFNEMSTIFHVETNSIEETIPETAEKSSSSYSRIKELPQYSLYLKAKFIIKLMDSFIDSSQVFKATGAVHTAAIASIQGIDFFYDDIGRRNAIDKCLGKALSEDLDLTEKILFVTCRISEDIVSKVVTASIPIIISRAPPTSSAIDLAKENNITIVGFCRESRFNVYSHPSRIIY